MDVGGLKYVYFLGIGGIGMSALARYFKASGIEVSGYDKTSTPLTKELEAEGISIHFEENIKMIPAGIDLVIYTPAVPDDHKEYQYFIQNNIPIMKRAEVLGLLTKKLFTIAVAGTHGKTTICSMIALILNTAGKKTNAFIGGISLNFGSNLLLTPDADIVVAEADEFDRSFLRLQPDIALISAMDADHLDIYRSYEYLKESFHLFARQVREKGTLVCKNTLDVPVKEGIKKTTYGLTKADYFAQNIRIKFGKFIFDLSGPQCDIKEIKMQVPGRHNIENALAAAAVCSSLGITTDQIKKALESYRGVKRRFEFRIRGKDMVFIDDYAHHPEELRACIRSTRELFPGKRITGIFQPHLYSRTRDLADDFARALDELDSIILLPIYPARELPISGINSEMLLEKIKNSNKVVVSKEKLNEVVSKQNFDVLITMGAGDIDQCVESIEKLLKRNPKAGKK
jgi:UDP-N-acetylmuramate--alanine ligase